MAKEMIALILAGGEGSRLGVLSKLLAKPAVLYGGKYRIIDFTLSNCINSGIDTVGVLTQYRPLQLNHHIGIGKPWDLDRMNGGVTILSPFTKQHKGEWYSGSADAVYQNIHYIEEQNAENVIILSGDHVYKMDYSLMLDYHKKNNADATISVINVKLEEASRYGIMNTTDDGKIYEFEETGKPEKHAGVYGSIPVQMAGSQGTSRSTTKMNNPCTISAKTLYRCLCRKKGIYGHIHSPAIGGCRNHSVILGMNMDLVTRVPQFCLIHWRIYTPNPVNPRII